MPEFGKMLISISQSSKTRIQITPVLTKNAKTKYSSFMFINNKEKQQLLKFN